MSTTQEKMIGIYIHKYMYIHACIYIHGAHVHAVHNTTVTVTVTLDAYILCHIGTKQCHGHMICLLYTSPSPRDATLSRMPSSA